MASFRLMDRVLNLDHGWGYSLLDGVIAMGLVIGDRRLVIGIVLLSVAFSGSLAAAKTRDPSRLCRRH